MTLRRSLYARPEILRGEQCTTGAFVRAPRREGAARVVADIAKLSVGREAYYTRELATDHETYLSGHGSPRAAGTVPAPPVWGCRAWTRSRALATEVRAIAGVREDLDSPAGQRRWAPSRARMQRMRRV
jgi:hypothetical protein